VHIFISWSGEATRPLSQAFKLFFERVLAGHATVWTSSSDLVAGDRFNESIAGNLIKADVGVLLITRQNMRAPWILFESGALAHKEINRGAIPILVDLERSELESPLSQFQNIQGADLSGMKVILETLSTKTNLSPDALEALLERFWPNLESALSDARDAAASSTATPNEAMQISELADKINALHLRANQAALREMSQESLIGSLILNAIGHPWEGYGARGFSAYGHEPIHLTVAFEVAADRLETTEALTEALQRQIFIQTPTRNLEFGRKRNMVTLEEA
jgi:hypothetical protein